MTESEAKRAAINFQLQRSDVAVLLDARQEGVVVPPKHKQNHSLVLNFGLNMVVPIPDLDIGETGISATLSFDRTPFKCFIPWSAVYAMLVDNEGGILFHQSKPPDVEVRSAVASTLEEPPAKQPNPFHLVDGDEADEPTVPDATPTTRPPLRLVD